MPPVCRRIATLVVVASLGVVGPATLAAAQQGAGDQQYQDPFADTGSGSTTTHKPATKPKTTPSGTIKPLSPKPQTSGGATGTAAPPAAAPAAPATSGTATARPAQTLPNTGIDARVLLLAGVALLLTGFGLRLRFAPERF